MCIVCNYLLYYRYHLSIVYYIQRVINIKILCSAEMKIAYFKILLCAVYTLLLLIIREGKKKIIEKRFNRDGCQRVFVGQPVAAACAYTAIILL